mgnify:CR=1 FL=1
MKKHNLASLALGSAVAAASLTSLAHAASDNPFAATKLEAGYQLAAADTKMKEGKCGEAKAAAGMKAEDKKMDGKCGAAKASEKKAEDKKMDGKCGEAKCGADKKK